MKALVIGHGTRGDVQPFVALAHALRQAGHQVVLGAPAGTVSLAEPYGIEVAPLTDNLNDMSDPELRAAMETNFRGLQGKRVALRQIRTAKRELRKVYEDIAAIPANDVDIVIHPVNSAIQHLAEKLDVPSVAVGLQPGWVPTTSMPSPFVPFRIPSALNRASYALNTQVLRALVRSTAAWRTETLGLPRRPHQNDALRTRDGRPATVLQAFSRHVLPVDAAYPEWTHTTGFWFLPAAEDWSPPERLAVFLDAGDPPVYLGFGSMAGRNPKRVGQLVAESVRLADVRVVLVTGWGGIDASLDGQRMLVLDQAPHDWLFPRMAAIVHHGGGGTTAAALASGRPQIVCPFVADQPFWARSVHRCGVATEPLPQRQLTPERLARALGQAVSDQTMAARAAELGTTIRAENGVTTAVRLIENAVSTKR